MKKSVLFFDIDGTLISDITNQIPESTIHAMRQAKKNGHLLFVNTGRTLCSLRRELNQIEFEGFLCGCGTYLTYRDEVLFQSSIEQKRGREIIDKMLSCRMEGVMEGTQDNYLPRKRSRFSLLEEQRKYFDKYLGVGRNQYIEDGDFVYDKMFVYGDEQSDQDTFFDFISCDLDVVVRGENMYEIIQKGYSKATACAYMLDRLGMSREDMYVFGDSTNDLEMFQCALHTVAMGDHARELEPYTEFVTKRVEEDGIAHALKHYGFI